MNHTMTRREWLCVAPAATLAACGHKKSPRFQGYALIANHDSSTIAVIDLSRFQVLTQVPVAAPPSWAIAAAAQSRAFVLSQEDSRAEVLNLDSMKIDFRVKLGGKPVDARLSPDARMLWVVLREPDALAALDTASGKRTVYVHLPSTPSGMDIGTGQVAIAFPDRNRVGRYSTDQAKFELSQPLDAAPRLICLRADGKVILTGNTEARSMTAVDASTLRQMVELPLPLAPRHCCLNSDGGQLFVTGDGMDAVSIVSPYQTEVSETILAGGQPCGMAATSSFPNYLFVGNQSGDVTVINIDTRRVVAQIPVGQKPNTVLLTPDNEYALVLNEQSGDVAVIRVLSIVQANLTSRRGRTAPLFTMIPVGGRPVGGSIAPRLT